MNRFEEMIQKGEDLIARTNELLDNEIDLATAGSVDIATYLTDLKAIHAESLEFTNPDVAESLEQYREGMDNSEYMDYLTKYLTIRDRIMGELRDRIYDRTGKVDMAFKARVEANNALYREMKALEADIEAINKDIAQLDKTIGILRNSGDQTAIDALEDAKKNMLARIAQKRARIEAIPREQEVLLHGGVLPAQPAQEDEHEAEEEHEEDHEVERPPLPVEDDQDEVEEEEHEQGDEHAHDGEDLIPAFPELEGDGDGDGDDLDQDDEEELGPLPVEDDSDSDSDSDSDDSDEDEEEEEEEEDQELTPIPEDEEVEVVHHTDAKPTLLRRIGNIVYAVVAFLSMAHLGVHIAEHGVSLDHEPAVEGEIQQDEDDLEDNPAPEDDEEQKDDDVVDTPDDQTPSDDDSTGDQDDDKTDDKEDDKEDDKVDDQTPGEDDDKDEDKDEDQEKDEESELGELPAELAPGEFIYDRETGLEVGATGDAYVHVGGETGGVTLEDGQRDLTATDHGTVLVGQEDMTTDQKLPELTGAEKTYEEVTQDMTAQEISDLDAALAEWAAQFDTGLTLKP